VCAEERVVESAAVFFVVVADSFRVDGCKAELGFEGVFVGYVGEDFDELRGFS